MNALAQFPQIVLRIIKEQESVIGPLAWDEARKVQGIEVVNQRDGQINLQNGDLRGIVDRLVAQYERIFGKASHEVFLSNPSPNSHLEPTGAGNKIEDFGFRHFEFARQRVKPLRTWRGVTLQPPYFAVPVDPFRQWPLAVEIRAPGVVRVRTTVYNGGGSGLFQLDMAWSPPSAPVPTEDMTCALVKISASGPMPTSRYWLHAPWAISVSLSRIAWGEPGFSFLRSSPTSSFTLLRISAAAL